MKNIKKKLTNFWKKHFVDDFPYPDKCFICKKTKCIWSFDSCPLTFERNEQ